jgi:hypothetical protein
LRELACGQRKVIKSRDIKDLGVPLYTGLSTNDILDWSRNNKDVQAALPSEPREIDKLLR